MDWRPFGNNYPKEVQGQGLLKQVRKTLGGKPIGADVLQRQTDIILKMLEIKKGDRVLDICCGNGILTRSIAENCEYVLGIDYSETLIEEAKKHNQPENIRYIHMDARNIHNTPFLKEQCFTKVLCVEALAYFNNDELDKILTDTMHISDENVIIALVGVLDTKKKWAYYNTFKRKISYLITSLLYNKKRCLGNWWNFNDIDKICQRKGLTAEKILPLNYYTSHYRFNVKIRK